MQPALNGGGEGIKELLEIDHLHQGAVLAGFEEHGTNPKPVFPL
jgi:hypothetical protein